MRYRYVGIREDNSTKILLSDVRSKGKAFVSAIKSVNKLRCHTNPDKFIRLEIQDSEGNILSEYKDNDMLKIYQ